MTVTCHSMFASYTHDFPLEFSSAGTDRKLRTARSWTLENSTLAVDMVQSMIHLALRTWHRGAWWTSPLCWWTIQRWARHIHICGIVGRRIGRFSGGPAATGLSGKRQFSIGQVPLVWASSPAWVHSGFRRCTLDSSEQRLWLVRAAVCPELWRSLEGERAVADRTNSGPRNQTLTGA